MDGMTVSWILNSSLVDDETFIVIHGPDFSPLVAGRHYYPGICAYSSCAVSSFVWLHGNKVRVFVHERR